MGLLSICKIIANISLGFFL